MAFRISPQISSLHSLILVMLDNNLWDSDLAQSVSQYVGELDQFGAVLRKVKQDKDIDLGLLERLGEHHLPEWLVIVNHVFD